MDVETLWCNHVEHGDSSGILMLNLDFLEVFKPAEDNGLDLYKLDSIDIRMFNEAFLKFYTLLHLKSSIHDFKTLVSTIVSCINDEYSSSVNITVEDFNNSYLDNLFFFVDGLFAKYANIIDNNIMDLLAIDKPNDSYRVLYRVKV